MKISCTQENLNQGLNIVSHIANKNANLPILSNILFKIEDKILTLIATNLEIGITTQVRGKVEQEGEFSVDAKLFNDYVSLLPRERVDLELEESNVKINCQKQNTKIKSFPGSDFPLIPKIKKENPYIITVKNLKSAINETAFSVSTSEARPELSGVLIHLNEGKMVLAATDSYRLAEKKISLVDGDKNERKIIVPVRTLQEISRILGVFKEDISLKEAENIEVYFSENQIMFSYNGTDLISRLIEGQYPDYTQIIPTEHKTRIKINTNNLIKAIKTASLFTKGGIYDVKLEILSAKKELVITSSSAQTGENTSLVEAEVEGVENSIVLNYRYLLDGLQNINSDTAILEINDGNNPCLLKPENNNNYLYIIMPIKQ